MPRVGTATCAPRWHGCKRFRKTKLSTSLRDTAFAGLALRGADNTRTLLLLFSDGLDTSSILGESRLMAIARRSDAMIYAIGVEDSPTPRMTGQGRGTVLARRRYFGS